MNEQKSSTSNDVAPLEVSEHTSAKARGILRRLGEPAAKNPNHLGLAATASADGKQIIIRIEQVPPLAPADKLIEFPFGFEASAARRLVRDRHLKSVKVGRKTYARMSDVLALVDTLPQPKSRARQPRTDQGYADLLAQARRATR